ncbi:MAG TPA: protein translocase subunit SecF [Candidatus Acidoferrales bacterium]|nr:protein translocase subunit SecF [Candidatus Acidoferrales bacterium]
MEFFHAPNIDWMGKAKYFVALSLTLLLIGLIAWFHQGGLLYGIDFRGGAMVMVRFASAPPIGQIRGALDAAGLKNNEVTSSRDISNPNSKNDVMINVEQKGEDEDALNASKQKILDALQKDFGAPGNSKPDFNSTGTTPADLGAYLTQRDPLALGTAAGDRYTQLAQRLMDARDKDHSGIVTNFDQLSGVAGATPAVISALKDGFALNQFTILTGQVVGPTVGAQLRRQAIFATLYALAGMLIYVAFRFSGGDLLHIGGGFFLWTWIDWTIFGVAAVIAVFHDVLITLGFFCLFHYQISLTVIAALLTLVGYSMNDTIVIFDRVRENLRLMRREPLPVIINRSINQTLSRTILTSGLTFLTVFLLFLFGGQVLRSFSFAMVVGVVVGTYSSFGIAAPIVVVWNKWRGQSATAPGSPAPEKRQQKRLAEGRS